MIYPWRWSWEISETIYMLRAEMIAFKFAKIIMVPPFVTCPPMNEES